MKPLKINLKKLDSKIDSIINFIDNEPLLYIVKTNNIIDILTNSTCAVCKSSCTLDLNKKIKLLLKNGEFQNTLVLHTPFESDITSLIFAEEIIENNNFHISLKNNVLSLMPIESTTSNQLESLPPLSSSSVISRLNYTYSTVKSNDFYILSFYIESSKLSALLINSSDDSIVAKKAINVDKVVDNPNIRSAILSIITDFSRALSCDINIVGIGITAEQNILSNVNINNCNNIAHNSSYSKAVLHFDSKISSIIEINKNNFSILPISNKMISKNIINEDCHYSPIDYFKYALEEYVNINDNLIENAVASSTNPVKFKSTCPYSFLKELPRLLNSNTKLDDFITSIIYLISQNILNLCDNSLLGNETLVIDNITSNNSFANAIKILTETQVYTLDDSDYLKAFGCAQIIKSQILEGSIKRLNLTLNNISKTLDLLPTTKSNLTGTNLIEIRNNLLFSNDIVSNTDKIPETIALLPNPSTNLLYPLYYNFFSKLGYKVILADSETKNIIYTLDTCDIIKNSFKIVSNLIQNNVNHIFLPELDYLPLKDSSITNKTCKFIEFEGTMLKNLSNSHKEKFLTPKINFSNGILDSEQDFIKLGVSLGSPLEDSANAFAFAVNKYKKYLLDLDKATKEAFKNISLSNLNTIVIFDKIYSDRALSLSKVIAKNGYNVVPFDLLPYTNENLSEDLYIESDRITLKSAKYVLKTSDFFALYLRTQNCEDDLFLFNAFSNIMQRKPFLTLSNIGNISLINKKIADFSEIVENYRDISNIKYRFSEPYSSFLPAQTYQRDDSLYIFNSDGTRLTLLDDNVCLIIPSIGENTSKNIAASFKYIGINAIALNSPTEADLKIGGKYLKSRKNIPAAYLLGSLLNFIDKNTDIYKTFVFLMPKNFDSNKTFLYINEFKNIINKNNIKNLAILTLDSTMSNISFNTEFKQRLVSAIVVSDILDNVYSALKVLAKDSSYALTQLLKCTDTITNSLENDNNKHLFNTFKQVAKQLSNIPTTSTLTNTKKVTILGENYSSKNETLRQNIVTELAEHNIIANTIPILSFFKYSNLKYVSANSRNLISSKKITDIQISNLENKIRKIFTKSGLYNYEKITLSDKVKNIMAKPQVPVNEIDFDINNSPLVTNGYISIGSELSTTNRIAKAMYPNTVVNKKTQKSLPFLSINTANTNLNKLKLDNFCNRLEL